MTLHPTVAILVPAYNEADHLAECLQSIVSQTYANWTATVVNNCSSDGTADLADEYARRDERIRVLHSREFVGQAENYNRALATVADHVDYVKFVEADNWIASDCVTRLVTAAEADPRVGIVGSYYLMGRGVCGSGLEPGKAVRSGRHITRMLFLQGIYLFGIPTSILFRAQALRGLQPWFRPGLFYDDADLCSRILREWDFAFVHQVLSFQRTDNHGVLSTYQDFDYIDAYKYFLLREYGLDFFSEKELPGLLAAHRRRYLTALANAYLRNRPREYWQFHQELWRAHGLELNGRELVVPIIFRILDRLGNPKATLEGLLRGSRSLSASMPSEPRRDSVDSTADGCQMPASVANERTLTT